jgi:hypothetical protein
MDEKEPIEVSIDKAALEQLPVSVDRQIPAGLSPCPKTCALTCIDTCKRTWEVTITIEG